SGQPLVGSVFAWVETADALGADISEPNHNVTYEVGLALGTQKSLRLIRAANKDRKLLEEIGLLHNIGHNDFNGQQQLIEILRRPYTNPPWPRPKRNTDAQVMSFNPLKPTISSAAPSATSKKSCGCASAVSIRRKLTASPLPRLSSRSLNPLAS